MWLVGVRIPTRPPQALDASPHRIFRVFPRDATKWASLFRYLAAVQYWQAVYRWNRLEHRFLPPLQARGTITYCRRYRQKTASFVSYFACFIFCILQVAHLSAKFQAATAKIVDLAVKYVRFLYHILHFTGSYPCSLA